LQNKNLFKESDGAKVIDLAEWKLSSALVVKRDGTTLYLSRDIVTAHNRWEKYKFEKLYYVVAAQQNLHFQQLFKILELMGFDWAKRCHHINFGMVMGMSTRKGNVVFLQDILDEAKASMLEVMKRNESKYNDVTDPDYAADIIGQSAVVVQDFSARRIKDYELNWSRMTSFEGSTGPYLQYAHARLCSIEQKALDQGVVLNMAADLSMLTENEALNLALQISKYPTALQKTLLSLEPVTLLSYLFDLGGAISLSHEKLRVLGQDVPTVVAEARLLLFWSARITLGNAMQILGLVPLTKM